ncbi:hypothetical protein HKD37_19G055060 [Glycine soja]
MGEGYCTQPYPCICKEAVSGFEPMTNKSPRHNFTAIREKVGVAPIVEKMVENRLRWFGHVERRPVDSVVRRVDQMERRQTIRDRGRPKKTIREVIKKDLELNDLDRSMILDRTL